MITTGNVASDAQALKTANSNTVAGAKTACATLITNTTDNGCDADNAYWLMVLEYLYNFDASLT